MEKRVLVVDDDEPIRNMLADAFMGQGYAVDTAVNAEEALAILAGRPIYVMFFDLKMPGMTGIELCRRVKSRYPISCIHALTGYISLFGLSDCLEAGFDDYFTKPVELPLLFEAAEHAFKKLERWTGRQVNIQKENPVYES